MATAFLRTVILYFLIVFGLRFLGKRQIGDLEPAELALTMMISDLATVPMQDFGIPLFSGIIPILSLLALSMLISQLSLKNLRFRAAVCGTPAVLIDRGHICQDAMRENRFTIDELLEELRGQGYCGIEPVKYAILEGSGQLSILPWPQEQPATARQLHQTIQDDTVLPQVLINDGRVLSQSLRHCGKDAEWLKGVLAERSIAAPRDVFLLTLAGDNEIFCVRKEAPK